MSASGFKSFVFTSDDASAAVIYRTLYKLGYRPSMVDEDVTINGPMENVVMFCGIAELSELIEQDGWEQPNARPRVILTMAQCDIDDACVFLPHCDGILFTDLGLERLDAAIELALDGYCTFPARVIAPSLPAAETEDVLTLAEAHPVGH